jgi:hypothetical protein
MSNAKTKNKQARVSPSPTKQPRGCQCMTMLSAKSIQSIENFDNKRTVDKEVKFELDSITNVYC